MSESQDYDPETSVDELVEQGEIADESFTDIIESGDGDRVVLYDEEDMYGGEDVVDGVKTTSAYIVSDRWSEPGQHR
ncbi:MAG: hypothetical protein ABEI58_00040 [Candidatus Nanohaloarchaea archaeon]